VRRGTAVRFFRGRPCNGNGAKKTAVGKCVLFVGAGIFYLPAHVCADGFFDGGYGKSGRGGIRFRPYAGHDEDAFLGRAHVFLRHSPMVEEMLLMGVVQNAYERKMGAVGVVFTARCLVAACKPA
jgi:hypothetical protein